MGLFGNKELDAAKRRADELQAAVEDARKDAARCKERADRETQARAAAEKARDEAAARIAEVEAARDREKELKAKADQAARFFEERYTLATNSIEKAARERDEAVARASEAAVEKDRAVGDAERLRGENERLKAQVEDLRARAAERPKREPRPEPAPAPAPVEGEARLDAEGLRREAADLSERLRIALRKAEHNRRAYLVTQMQLDLAEDRLHLLTKGTPRPVHPGARFDGPAEPMEAEDVEGYEDEDAPVPVTEAPAPAPAPVPAEAPAPAEAPTEEDPRTGGGE